MQLSRARLRCRSHNPFSPSIALWQHFVSPIRNASHQQRLSSAAADVAEPAPESDANPPTDPASPSQKPQNPQGLRRPLVRTIRHDWPVAATGTSEKPVYGARALEGIMERTQKQIELGKNYDGVVLPPMQGRPLVAEPYLPWASIQKRDGPKYFGATSDKFVLHHTGDLGDFKFRLDREIAMFHEYLRPNKVEALARKQFVEQVIADVQKTLPTAAIEVFGSERTGLASATSDIDLRLWRPNNVEDGSGQCTPLPPPPAQRKQLVKDLRQLHYRSFSRNPEYIAAEVLHSRYPLLSLQHRDSGIDVQIVLANDTTSSRNIVKQYLEQYPYLDKLYSVVKTMFDVRGISDVYRGGLGSYSIFMMIVASLQRKPEIKTAGHGLRHFLHFWTNYDTTTHGLSIQPMSEFNKLENPVMTEKAKAQLKNGEIKPLPKFMLSLQDPADPTNDLGRKAVCYKHIKATIIRLRYLLEYDLKVNTRYCLLGSLVGASYALNLSRRRKLQAHGERLLTEMEASMSVTAQQIREADSAQPRPQPANDAAMTKAVEESSHLGHGDAIASVLGMPKLDEFGDGEEHPQSADTTTTGPVKVKYFQGRAGPALQMQRQPSPLSYRRVSLVTKP